MQRSDREMMCAQCGQAFRFSSGEQDFYQQNQLQEPRRCKGCRGARTSPERSPSGSQPGRAQDTPRDRAKGRGANQGYQARGDGLGRSAQPALTSHGNYGNSVGTGYTQAPRRREGAQGFRPAAADDPNGYRSPGFQDGYSYKIDYGALPKDDEADEQAAMLGNSKVQGFVRPLVQGQSPRPTRNGHPRGMNGRQLDRSGTDPDAYRSPGFAKPAARSPIAVKTSTAEDSQGHEGPQGEQQGEQPVRGRGRRSRQRPRFETVCIECGAPAVVPFQPAEDRPAFCKPCYLIKKPLLNLGPGKKPIAPESVAPEPTGEAASGAPGAEANPVAV